MGSGDKKVELESSLCVYLYTNDHNDGHYLDASNCNCLSRRSPPIINVT